MAKHSFVPFSCVHAIKYFINTYTTFSCLWHIRFKITITLVGYIKKYAKWHFHWLDWFLLGRYNFGIVIYTFPRTRHALQSMSMPRLLDCSTEVDQWLLSVQLRDSMSFHISYFWQITIFFSWNMQLWFTTTTIVSQWRRNSRIVKTKTETLSHETVTKSNIRQDGQIIALHTRGCASGYGVDCRPT